ncbi:uncharacterized protein LOC133193261 [Saccostrea echinata]|uniref:uncharacterized protein LOC133193261 n=1 Tax=Saccostrea echinata TaxID=191078 RepID=UPI002A81041C|nr:uncharacterized protein LOC133193261 [Saccostrea echinata]
MDPTINCCACQNRGQCKSCVCRRRGCTNCRNANCQFREAEGNPQQSRFHPYANNSRRNSRGGDGVPSLNQMLEDRARPENNRDQGQAVSLQNAITSMPEAELRARVSVAATLLPDVLAPYLLETSGFCSGNFSVASWCCCGKCTVFPDPRMNICCGHPHCITTRPEFRNLCLRHDVIEIANILNWSFRTNLDPSFRASTFRNQAYRNFVLWQHGRLGAGRRVVVPSCVCRQIRLRFPEVNPVDYKGYESLYSDSD